MTRTRRLSHEELAPYLLEFLADSGCVDLVKVFNNERPVEIEVGCGKGLFLLTAALAAAEANFLGIELDRKYQLFAATRIAKRALLNVRMASADARIILAARLAPACATTLRSASCAIRYTQSPASGPMEEKSPSAPHCITTPCDRASSPQ